MKKNSNKPQLGLLGLVIKYKISLLFLVIFVALFQQNILINGFPMTLSDRQNTIDNIVAENSRIEKQNKILQAQISDYSEGDLILIESRARYKYGLIKEGETYYQINTIVEVDNSDETPDSSL